MRAESRPMHLPHSQTGTSYLKSCKTTSWKPFKYWFYSEKHLRHLRLMLIKLNFSTSSCLDMSCLQAKSKTCRIKVKSNWYWPYTICFRMYLSIKQYSCNNIYMLYFTDDMYIFLSLLTSDGDRQRELETKTEWNGLIRCTLRLHSAS